MRRGRAFPLSLLVLVLSAAPLLQSQEEPSIRQLDWLIGEWEFEDAQVDGDYRETGTRVCEYALEDHYIVCESRGTSHTGVERTYLNYFNYNHLDRRFEITALFAGFPRKILYEADVSPDGHRLELNFGGWEASGIVIETHAIVVYNGADQYTWESHAAHDGPETGEHTVRYRDVVTRTAPPRR